MGKKIIVETSGNSKKLRYEMLPGEQLDDTALDRFKQNTPPGIAPVQHSDGEGNGVFYMTVPNYGTLDQFIKKVLPKVQVLELLKNILSSMDIGKFSIPVSYIVKDFEQIPAALDYFLGSLANWNQAKVYSYEIAQKFTTRKLLEKWKSVRAALEASD